MRIFVGSIGANLQVGFPAHGGLINVYAIPPSKTSRNLLDVGVAGTGRFVQRTHPSGLNSTKGSWLCDWPWPITPRTHLVLQALEDQTPSRMLWARHQFLEAFMSDIAAKKQAARNAAMITRKAAHHAQSGAGQAAAAHLLSWLETTPNIKVIAGYMPIHSELDVLPAMHQLHALGYQICVPVIMAKATPLRFKAWQPDGPMVRGEFGALIPESGEWLQPELLLCPMLAFDTTGQRMGYGGGYYDRSIAELAPVQTLGFAYAAQQVTQLPSEPTDMPLSAVITESGIIWSGL